jgi:hypothetical protein
MHDVMVADGVQQSIERRKKARCTLTETII